MDIKEKIVNALREPLSASFIRLEDDDGISGFVVSSRFEGISSLDRQGMIEDVLSSPSASLTPDERRQILMIAALTPAEYDAVGASIRVQKVKKMPDGTIEVRIHGGLSDAEYVRGALDNLKGVQTTQPKQVPGAIGVLMSFRAKGSEAAPLTKDKVVRMLRKQAYVALMPGA